MFNKVFIFAIAFCIFLNCFSLNVYAQLSSLFDNMNPMKTSETVTANDMTTMQMDKFPVGNVIDATAYQIGPNDILSIQVFPEPIPQMVIVNSECIISHSRFGDVSVLGMTLQQVRDTLNFIANQRREGAKVSVSLTQARKVFVEIRGNVTSPGTYTLPATYSVATAIRFANNPQITSGLSPDEQSAITGLQEARKEREKMFSESGVAENTIFSTRNIRLVRNNGSAVIVDIERANATGNAAFNPFISEGDVITVPFELDIDFPTVSIAGAVIRPASVVFKQGDMASHLLKMGYGFTENADLDNVILLNENGSQKLTVDSAGNLLSEDIQLNSSSAIVVGTKTERIHSNFGIVSVKGEVNKPSIYQIEKGKTKLKDVIEMAGGFTSLAHLPLATVGRRDNSQNERVSARRKYSEYFEGSNMTQQDTLRFQMVMERKFPIVSCDFVSVFENNLEEYNILLRDGDVINIPAKPNRVFVFGQVNKPGFVDFEEGKTMEWYIMKAGGYASNAAKKRARIVRGSNRVWEDGHAKNVYVDDGDEVFVASPRDVPPEMELQKWAAYAGMAGVLLTLISVSWGVYRDSRNLRR
jgi:protein involved in polysaccharide export with SLBB domain